MKNHIVFKFIAVLLCAASLLGAVAGGIGVFAMTEMDLYDKSVDQVYAERVQEMGQQLANEQGLFYASYNLGGCPLPMVQNRYADLGDYFNAYYYGFQLKDAEGNVLQSQELPAGEPYTTYTFDVTGQYMHFVDQTLLSEQAAQATEPPQYMDAEYDVLVNDIPPEGAVVCEAQISTADSSSGASGGELGTVFCNQQGQVILRCPGWDIGEDGQTVTAIALMDRDGMMIYEASAEDGVGIISYDPDRTDLIFTSFPMAAAPVAEPAAAAEESVPATTEAVEESIPETTAVEETIPVETAAEAVAAVAETTPAETAVTAEAAEAAPAETAAEATEATAAPAETTPVETAAPAETAAAQETTPAVTEAAVAEAVAETADSAAEAVPAAEGTEATEETVAPTVAETIPEETIPEETVPQETVPERVLINGKPLESYQINRTEYYDHEIGETVSARYVYLAMPEMTLEFHVAPGALSSEASYTLMRIIQYNSGYLFPVMGICLLIFAVTLVYLFCAAAKTPGTTEIRAGGLNRLPLDAYFLLGGTGVACLCVAISEGGYYLLRQNVNVGIAFMAVMGYLAALLVVGFLFACAAQFRTPGGFWWRNSLVGWSLKLCAWLLKKLLVFCQWLERWTDAKGWPMLKRLCKWIWGIIAAVWLWFWNNAKRIYNWMYSKFSCFYDLLPMTWQWILTGSVMVIFLFITVAGRFDFGIILAILFAFALVIYGAHCFGSLMAATRKMNKGDLNSKADDKLMIGAFKDFAHDLNDLADVAVVAAQKQLKSERMKTELITNVSHDIKTPLTSIINYVDLLQKPHTEEEQEQYLEVLDRQSQRLKKLIDDLMDMSKASTGNMAVDITLVDAVESVNQALGEFADKLDRAELTPVFRHTEDTVAMMADGRLVWRVLSNLLSNAVKYAMPGTRLYIDLMSLENKVVISLKNISRDELNVDAEELMERFVRGDDSRNTEGSGLGLNIAKSLMELQKGQLQLLVDGDLFKVTLIFPGL